MNRLIGQGNFGNRRVNTLDDNQHFFQAVLESAERNENLLLGLSLMNRRHFADRQTLRKNAIVSRSEKPLALVDLLLILNVFYLARAFIAQPLKSSVHPIVLRDHPGGERLV